MNYEEGPWVVGTEFVRADSSLPLNLTNAETNNILKITNAGANLASIQSVDIDLFSLFANYSYLEINSVTVRYSILDDDAKDGTNTYDIDANKLSLAHNSALSDDFALVLKYSMEESDHIIDQDTFAVELLYAF